MKEYKKLFALLCEIKPSTVTFEGKSISSWNLDLEAYTVYGPTWTLKLPQKISASDSTVRQKPARCKVG